jgi:hypothetical protein
MLCAFNKFWFLGGKKKYLFTSERFLLEDQHFFVDHSQVSDLHQNAYDDKSLERSAGDYTGPYQSKPDIF